MKTQIATYIKKSGAIAVPLSTLGGLFADLLRPLGNIAWAVTLIASLVLIVSFFKWFKGDKKVLDAQKKSGELDAAGYQGKVDKNKWFTVFSFSAIAVPILLIFSLITSVSSEKGFMGDNVPSISSFQNSLFQIEESMNEMNQKQDEILDNVKDIKDIVSGDSELKNMSNSNDLTVVKELNEKTKDKNAKRVAILYFDNTSGEVSLNKLKKGLAGMLISDLSNVTMLNIVERDQLESIIKEQNLSNSKEFDASTAAKLGKLLGAEIILTGAYFEMFGTFRIDARFINVETGEILKSEGVEGESKNFFKLQKQLVWKIIKNLDIKLSPSEKSIIENSAQQAVSYQATLMFSEALDFIDKGQKDKAKDKLNIIIQEFPGFVPAQKELENLTAVS